MIEEDDIILVDAEDNELGSGRKLAVHQNNLCHRAFSVFIFRENDGALEVLMQKRNQAKYHCGGLWTNTCCGHPRPGQQTMMAAENRLLEEMGFTQPLTYAGMFHYQVDFENDLSENEVDHVFYAYYNEQAIEPNADEVEAFEWVLTDDLLADIECTPLRYTPWLKQALNLALGKVENENTN